MSALVVRASILPGDLRPHESRSGVGAPKQGTGASTPLQPSYGITIRCAP